MPNCFEDMPFFTHNVEVMLNDELKPNFAELLRTSANLSAPTAGLGAEFCSCVESVLAIGHLQLQKGVEGDNIQRENFFAKLQEIAPK